MKNILIILLATFSFSVMATDLNDYQKARLKRKCEWGSMPATNDGKIIMCAGLYHEARLDDLEDQAASNTVLNPHQYMLAYYKHGAYIGPVKQPYPISDVKLIGVTVNHETAYLNAERISDNGEGHNFIYMDSSCLDHSYATAEILDDDLALIYPDAEHILRDSFWNSHPNVFKLDRSVVPIMADTVYYHEGASCKSITDSDSRHTKVRPFAFYPVEWVKSWVHGKDGIIYTYSETLP